MAYTYPGIIVVTEPPPTGGPHYECIEDGGSERRGQERSERRVTTTMAQILFVFTFVLKICLDQLLPTVQTSCVLAKHAPADL